MLIWHDVNASMHGWLCSVIFDASDHPFEYKRFDGRINCGIEFIPYLENIDNKQTMMPPPWATVILHTPMQFERIWPS